MNSAGPADPGSWNRYTYTRGDPVNRFDPRGTSDCAVGATLPCTDEVTGAAPSPTNSSTETVIDNVGYGCNDLWCGTEGLIDNALSGIEIDYVPSDQSLLWSIQSTLDKALADPNCAKIFGSSGSLTAAQVLDSLISSTLRNAAPSAYGSIAFTDQPLGPYGDSAATTSAGFWGQVKHSLGFSVPSTVTISSVYNEQLGFFNTSAYNAEVTVFHELGHVLSNLNFKGDQIGNDAKGGSAANTSKVEAACGKDLSNP